MNTLRRLIESSRLPLPIRTALAWTAVSALFWILALGSPSPAHARILGCPAGMTSYASVASSLGVYNGDQNNFCIDTAANGGTNYNSAVDACATAGKTLCDLREWSVANFFIGFGGGKNWVYTTLNFASLRFDQSLEYAYLADSSVGSPTAATSTDIHGSSHPYRCCIH